MRRASTVGAGRPIRGGYTLMELLVAISLSGIVVAMVGQWIVHEVRARASSDRRIDADEAVSSFRNGLFQDLHRGRILSLSRERMEILRGGISADPDTIVWAIESGKISRRQGALSTEPLAGLRNLEVSWDPVPLVVGDAFGSAWWRLDRDQDGTLEASEFDSVGFVDVHILGEVATVRGFPPVRESLTVGIPSAGL